MTLHRWTGPLDTGAFRFGASEDGPIRALMLRSTDGTLHDPDGRPFCTLEEFDDARREWRGLPAIVVRRHVVGSDTPGPVRVTFMDGTGIDAPDTFRARML